jgi:hypothetical protein
VSQLSTIHSTLDGDDRLEMEVSMQKSMGLRNPDLQKRAHLVAHLKRVSVNQESSAVRRPLDGAKMNANVRTVLMVLEDIYLKK